MKKLKIFGYLFWSALLLIFLSACMKAETNLLVGTWQMDGPMAMTIHFRDGEMESLGMIEKVSYKIRGNEVIVTSESGPMKGIAARYTVTGPNTAVLSGIGQLTRIR